MKMRWVWQRNEYQCWWTIGLSRSSDVDGRTTAGHYSGWWAWVNKHWISKHRDTERPSL